MKVVELINKLNEIGYNENTELTFGCVNKTIGEWYELKLDDAENEYGIYYGEELTGLPYNKEEINIFLNVDDCEDYLKEKGLDVNEVLEDLRSIIYKYER